MELFAKFNQASKPLDSTESTETIVFVHSLVLVLALPNHSTQLRVLKPICAVIADCRAQLPNHSTQLRVLKLVQKFKSDSTIHDLPNHSTQLRVLKQRLAGIDKILSNSSKPLDSTESTETVSICKLCGGVPSSKPLDSTESTETFYMVEATAYKITSKPLDSTESTETKEAARLAALAELPNHSTQLRVLKLLSTSILLAL